ncbi:hypothetical protein, partial [Methylicorpusculum sp.]|uniref:hypothetical protein n=1 Tax=Methylicorpusculum sp. TaxID=2713644 RepID=UPI002AB972C9
MSLCYSVDTKIDASYNQNSIKKILESGENLGFIYRNFTMEGPDLSLPELSAEDATKAVFLSAKENEMACLF